MTVDSIWGQGAESPSVVGFTGTLATEFGISAPGQLAYIAVYSPDTDSLPSACAIFNLDASTVVPGTENDSPSWSVTDDPGWIVCDYDGSVTLEAGVNYATSAYFPGITAAYLGGFTWPVSNGILTASGAMYSTNVSLSLPANNAGSFSYLVDVGITVGAAASPSGLVWAGII